MTLYSVGGSRVKYVGTLLIFMIYLSASNGQLTLFMSHNETQKLLGIDADIAYIVRNHLMTKAISVPVVINSSFTDHVLYWQNFNTGKSIGYTIDFILNHADGLQVPLLLNTPSAGVVPNQLSAISMVYNCTGKRTSVDLDMRLNLTNWLSTNVTSVVLKRTKLCTNAAPLTPVPSNVGEDVSLTPVYKKEGLLVTDAVYYTATGLPKPSSTEIFYVAVGVASAVIILVAVVIFTLYIRTRRQTLVHNDRPSVIGSSNHGSSHLRLDGNKHSSLLSLPSSRRGTLSSYSQLPHTQDVRITLQSLAINRKSVTLGETLIEGVFGKMLHGVVYVQDESEECYEQNVLVKTVSDEATEDQIQSLMVEGSMLKGLTHECINPLIAACTDGLPLLIYPTCEKGNLKSLLKKSNRISEHFPVLNTQQLVSMAMQVVKGLHYLHRKHLIHKDIAARNCCVDSNLNVKVMDNALSRDLFPDDYIHLQDGELRPVKWMAFETLTDWKYSYETDVWSFGVLLWELITFAQQPYSDISPFDMSSYLYSGCRLLQPVNCPDELFAVMAYCWAAHPRDRPNLPQILACLQEFYNTLSCFV